MGCLLTRYDTRVRRRRYRCIIAQTLSCSAAAVDYPAPIDIADAVYPLTSYQHDNVQHQKQAPLVVIGRTGHTAVPGTKRAWSRYVREDTTGRR